MPVATMLTVAALFWAGHGYTAQPVTWEWGIPVMGASMIHPGNVAEGFAMFNSDHIYLNREWWDRAPNWQRCEVVIHEVGHAAFGFAHTDGTVMSEIDGPARPVPGTCKRKWRK